MNTKRILALILSFLLLMSSFGTVAFADTDTTVANSAGNETQGSLDGAAYVESNAAKQGASGISGEASGVVGKESFVVKFFKDANEVGSTTLNDPDKILLNGVSKSISWHSLVGKNTDSWWTNTWVNGKLTLDTIPDTAELWVDGVEVDECAVSLDNAGASPIFAAVTDADGYVTELLSGTGYTYTQTPPSYDDAFSLALENGGNITLLRDIAIEDTLIIPEEKTVVLDLNGHNVSVKYDDSAQKHIYAFNNKGTLTLKDTKGTGSISARGIYNGYTGNTDEGIAGAKMIIEGGTYIALDTNGGAAIFNCAELVINDGIFEGETAAVNNRKMGNMTIKSGTFRTPSSGSYAIQNNGGNLTIDYAVVDSGFGAVGAYSGTTVINDGEFLPTGRAESTCHVVYVGEAAKVEINGGTYKMNYPADAVPDSGSAITSYYNGTVEINGGNFTSHFDNVSPVELSEGATIKGGTYLVHSGAASNHSYITEYLDENVNLNENGEVVTNSVTVAKIGNTSYETIDEAITAANAMTGSVTVELYGKVEYTDSTPDLIGSYDKISFVGKTDDAEISITRNGSNGYISGSTAGNDCAVSFADLILSKPTGVFANDAGFMNVAFTVYRVGSVSYTNCTFPNGACAAGCPTKYFDCTFNKSNEKYALWAYGSSDIEVDSCAFDDDRGIKMYAEDAAKTTAITVTNSDFSKLTGKPAIVLTLGDSITLENNTYSETGVLELEDNGSSNGATIVSDDPITCISDAYPDGCGVLVGDKIYRTVADAAAVAEEGDTVTLLHDSAETVELPEGVTLDKNGFAAEGVTVEVPNKLEGEGTKESPYLVNSLDDLKAFRDDVNDGNTYEGKYILLTNDIDLEDEDWTPIGTSSNMFKGHFDGGEKTISNLTINGNVNYYDNPTSYVGLFGRMKDSGSIKNVNIHNVDITGCLYVGAVLGRIYVGDSIENCHVTGSIDIEGYWYVGGIVGRAEYINKIDGCSVIATTDAQGTIEADVDADTNKDIDGSYVGGIVGFTTEPNPVVTISNNTTSNIYISGNTRIGGISGIAHQGNVFKENSVSRITLKAIQTEEQANGEDANTIGLIAGACQGTTSSPVLFENNTVETETSKAYINDKEVTSIYGDNIDGETPVTNFVAKINDVYYSSLADALAAANEVSTAENVVTIQLVAGELELGNVLFPATVNNVIIKGAENKATILKNSSLRSADGNNVDYQNITIDGIKFDNSYILFTGWRTNGVTYKDWTITNCEFYNITEEQAAVAFNLASAFAGDADEAMENFTFINNTINGVTGEYKSGVVINAAEGDVLIDNNVIKNVGWNAVQILNVPYYMGDNTDKSDKSTIKITNNVFENAGADEGIINVYAPTGKGQVAKVYVNENKILAKNNTQPYICYAQDYKVDAKNNFWGVGTEGTAVIDLDYANKLIDVTGDKVGGSSGFNMPYYKTEAMDELYWEAKIGDKYYATVTNALSVAKEGDTVVVLENATINTSSAYRGDITLDLNEKTLTVTNDLSAYDETTLTIKNGTIDLGETGTISVGISDARFGYGVVTVSEDVVITGSGDVNVIVWNGTLNTAGVIENTGKGKAISGNGMWDTTEINITGGTVKAANDTAIYHPQAGTISVSGGSVEGDVAIVLKGGSLEISGGTLVADGEANEYSAVSSGYVLTGDVLQIEHMDDSTDSDYYGTPTVSITGGTFVSENGNAVGSYTNTDMEKIVDFVSGGIFSNDVSDYAVDGYEVKENEDGTYGVVPPVTITTAEELVAFAKDVNENGNTYAGKYVVLANDIDLKGSETNLWTPIGASGDSEPKFRGTFDGQGHTISNLYVKQGAAYHAAGLFGATNGTIKNLAIDGAYVESLSSESATVNGTAVLAGSTAYGADIENVHVKNATVKGNRYVAGIVGYMDGTVKNCSVENVTIIATPDNLTGSYDNGDKVGGIVGYTNSGATEVSGCELKGKVNITGYRDIGGVAGMVQKNVAVSGNTNSAEVTITVDQITNSYGEKTPNAGEFVGRNDNSAPVLENTRADGATFESTVTTPVAKIGESNYGTLDAALEVAENGETITMLADVSDEVVVSKVTIINLNGFTANIVAGEGYKLAKNEYQIIVLEDGMLATVPAYIRNIATTNNAGEDRYQVIFLAGIDSLDYSEVGFEITIAGETREIFTKTVYSGYKAAGKTYAPDEFGEESEYIFGQAINFKTDLKNEKVVYRPYAKTFDGEYVWGITKTINGIYTK